MSDERLELVRRSYAAFSRLDPDGIDGLFQPDAVWQMGPMAPVSPETEWRGPEGVRGFIEAIRAEFESYSTEIAEWRWLGDRLLVRAHNRVGTRTVAEPLEMYAGQVIEFRDGLMSRVEQTDDPPPGWDEAEPAPESG